MEERPTPEQYQPPLTRWGHAWRTALMLLISVVAWLTVAERQSDRLLLIDLALGLPTLPLVFLRRRWPLAVALLTAAAGSVSSVAAGPATLAAVSLATRRGWRQVLLIGAVSLASAQTWSAVQPADPAEPLWVTVLWNVALTGGMLAWGLYLGSRRELVWTLRQRAERAEAEQELRAENAREHERARIAREMHDVLAHRISQISLHAGALTFRDDLTAAEMRSSAAVIQQKAHEALTDLRGVLGVLRDHDGQPLHRPQPTYDDLGGLVEDARAAGLRVEYDDDLDRAAGVPDPVGRTLYRIVQEGITNVRKHAPGTTLSIRVSGSPDDGVEIEMRNPLGFSPVTAGARTPGAGLGLVGLAERAQLRGGRLEHHCDGSTFVVRGWVPWAA